MEPRNSSYRWVMLGLVWFCYFVFGVITRSMAPLVSPVLNDLGMSFVEMGFILGSWQLTYIGFANIDGAFIDRWGIKWCLFAGVIIMGLSEVLRYFAGGFISFLFCVALIGIGGPMISIGSPKAIALWFSEKERGLATGIYMTAPNIGGLLALATANSVVMPATGNSWRLTFVVYSAVAFIAAALWLLRAREAGGSVARSSVSVIRVFSSLARLRLVQVILLMGLLSFTVNHAFDSWIPQILEARGISPAQAGLTATIPLIVGIPAVLFIPRIAPARYRSYIITLLSTIAAIALAIIATSSGLLLMFGLALFGLSSVPAMPLLILILMETPDVGPMYMGSAAGMFFCIAEVGGFAGPLVLGTIRNLTGNFMTGMVLIGGFSILLAIMGIYLQRKALPRSKSASKEPV